MSHLLEKIAPASTSLALWRGEAEEKRAGSTCDGCDKIQDNIRRATMNALVLDLREDKRGDERRELGKESQFSVSSHLPARTLVLALSIAAVFTLGIYANDLDAASSSTRGNVGVRESSTNSSTVVNTKNGPIQGIRTNGTVAFMGIPYAKPPIGVGRYRSPLPAEPWNGTLQATDFGPGCPQKCELPPIMCPTKQSEDCLYLNVFVPDAEPPEGGWPVYVFIHGGAYENGHAGTLAYVGFGFAENEIITVTMNYRLGALGFLAYGELGGNYGFQDQILSLKWVQENIEAFGGDRDRVTVGGESAGAVSVMAHMAAPLSQGLFSKAIMESSPVALPFSKPKDNRFYNHYIEVTGCSSGSSSSVVDCLKNMTAESVVDAMVKAKATIFPFPNPDIIAMPWTPTIGTVDLPVHPYIAMLNQQSSKVPVLVGGNTEDARVFVFGCKSSLPPSPLPTNFLSLSFSLLTARANAFLCTNARAGFGSLNAVANFTMNPIEYYLTLFDLFGKDGPRVLEAYPSVGFGDQRETIERLVTDYLFQCLGRFVAET